MSADGNYMQIYALCYKNYSHYKDDPFDEYCCFCIDKESEREQSMSIVLMFVML